MSDPSGESRVPYIEATDETALNDALAKIADVLATCEVQLDDLGDADAEMVDKEKTNLYLDGEVIPFDAKSEKVDGWGWVDAPQRTKIELYGKACTSFKTNRKTSVIVEFGCMPITDVFL